MVEGRAVPEGDLCTLLMNLLDNALEACRKVEEDRWIRFQAQVNRGILFIQCENSYQGSLRKDGRGRLLTTKEEPELHEGSGSGRWKRWPKNTRAVWKQGATRAFSG